MAEENLFKKLTTLFRSGPTIKRKVKQFQGSSSPTITRLNSVSGNDLSGYVIEDIIFTLNHWSGDSSAGTIAVQVDVHGSVIPEPSSVAILLIGSLGVVGVRRRFSN